MIDNSVLYLAILSEFFQMSQLFAWGGQRTGVSALASFLPKKSQVWSPSEWTGWISYLGVFIRQISVTDRRWSWDCARSDHVAIMHWSRDCECMMTWLFGHWSRVYQAMISDWQATIMGLCTLWSRGSHALITWLRMHWWRQWAGRQ